MIWRFFALRSVRVYLSLCPTMGQDLDLCLCAQRWAKIQMLSWSLCVVLVFEWPRQHKESVCPLSATSCLCAQRSRSWPTNTAYCIWSVISSISNLNRESNSLGLFCHVPLKRDQGDWDWRLSLNDTPNAIGCTRCRSWPCHSRRPLASIQSQYRVAKTHRMS